MKKFKVIAAGMVGNALEFYDFTLYGFLAPVIAPLFFPSEDKHVSLIASLGVFAVGFIVRPLGAILFGHIGDRFGRKRALALSIILMAIPTTLIGLLPTYDMIGLWAPCLLTVCRLIQGLCTGGEFTGAAIFVIEHQQNDHPGFSGGLITSSCVIGALLGNFIGMACISEGMPGWAWRIPFILGILIGAVGMYIRRRLDESPMFQEVQSHQGLSQSPLWDAIKRHPRSILSVVGAAWMQGAMYYTCFIYVSIHLVSEVHWPLPHALAIVVLGLLIYAIGTPITGALADRFNSLSLMIPGTILAALLIYPVFLMLNTGKVFLVILGQSILGIVASIFSGPINLFTVKLFPVRDRYSGVAFSYSLGMAFFGGTTPMILTSLIKYFDSSNSPALWIIISAFAGFFSLMIVRKSKELYTRGVHMEI